MIAVVGRDPWHLQIEKGMIVMCSQIWSLLALLKVERVRAEFAGKSASGDRYWDRSWDGKRLPERAAERRPANGTANFEIASLQKINGPTSGPKLGPISGPIGGMLRALLRAPLISVHSSAMFHVG